MNLWLNGKLYRGWICGAAWWYWPIILLWEWPRNWIVNWWIMDCPWRNLPEDLVCKVCDLLDTHQSSDV